MKERTPNYLRPDDETEHQPADWARTQWHNITNQPFEDHYLGHWPTRVDFAAELAIGLGLQRRIDGLPDVLRRYLHLDLDQLAADLDQDYLMLDDTVGACVHVFEQPFEVPTGPWGGDAA
jgi:hypothetical protein